MLQASIWGTVLLAVSTKSLVILPELDVSKFHPRLIMINSWSMQFALPVTWTLTREIQYRWMMTADSCYQASQEERKCGEERRGQ